MHERQAVRGLHDAEDELARDAADVLVHAEGAQIVVDLALAVDAHGGQVVEHRREILIDQRPDLPGQFRLEPVGVIHQCVHGAQEMLVGHALGHGRHGHGLQPARAAQLRVRRAETVEDHRPDEGLDVQLALSGPQSAAEGAIEAEVFPQLVQRENVSIGSCRRMSDPEPGRLVASGGAAEPPDQGVEVTVLHAVDAPEIGDHPVAGLASLVAVGLDDLEIAPPTALVDAHEHNYLISAHQQRYNSPSAINV